MINRVAKGNYNKNKCRKQLEAEGYRVITARRGYQGQEIDYFGLFDVCAYKDGYFRWIQVKSNQCPNAVRDAIRAFMTDGRFVTREIWIYKDYSRNNPWIEIIR